MNDRNMTCRIKRSDRPCLICTGHMDLIEASPPKFNLFGGMPFVCNSEGIDCLDCPQCGFTTTTADYDYLSMCKKDRLEIHNARHRRRENSIARSSSFSHGRSSNGRSCTSCHTPMESSSWHYCPKCGNKCSAPVSERSLSRSREPSPRNEIPKDIIINPEIVSMSDESENVSKKSGETTASRTTKQNEMVRTVTPPVTRTSINTDYLGPVEMQY